MSENTKIIYPGEPMKPVPKPIFERNKRPKPPKESLWFAHDPAIFHDPASGNYYIYCTNAICYRSKDLISWENIGRVVENPPQDSIDWTGSNAIWAPDILKVGDEYRLYCSNSSWGVSQSAIFLAISDNAEGPFIPKECVIKTSHTSEVNAIDANPVVDELTGKHYMAYGSFWRGCFIIELDPETGLAAEEGLGTQIATRPLWFDGAIEGPYIKYNSETGYYYLFVSYGSLNSDYNIRVGRSKNITGPYYDHNGRCMTDFDDYTNEVGYLLHGGYKFGQAQAWMGPGHNSVLHDDDDQWYLICHIRQHNFNHPEVSTMHCHKILWTVDGWPVINPCEYAGEVSCDFDRESLVGIYEHIKLAPAIPQGITTSAPMRLFEDGRVEMCSVRGHWHMIDSQSIEVKYGNVAETLLITPAWDYDNWKPTIALTGKDQNSICVWGIKS